MDINRTEISAAQSELHDNKPANIPPRPTLTEECDISLNAEKPECKPGDKIVSISKYISAIFSPLLVPTYCAAIAMWLSQQLSPLPENSRFKVSLMILFITGLIPLAMILALITAGYVKNLDITNRRERFIPAIATGLCYIAAAIFVHRLGWCPDWLSMVFVGAFLAAIICSVVSLWWKISAHGMAIGAIIGMLIRLSVSDLSDFSLMPWIFATIIIGGFIGMARVALQRHTILQFFAGELLGIVAVFTATAYNLPFVTEHISPILY